MTSSLVDLSGSLAPGWTTPNPVGYYVHQGTVYLSGMVTSDGTGATTETIFPAGTLPIGVRPATAQAVTFPLSQEDKNQPPFPGYALPTVPYAAHINTDGSVTLDDPIPGYINTTPTDTWTGPLILSGSTVDPGTTHPMFTAPLTLGVYIGNTSWPVSPVLDTYVTTSLAADIDTSTATDIDAAYSAHVERIHLTGSVTVAADIPGDITDTLPADAASQLPPSHVTSTTVTVAAEARGARVAGQNFLVVDQDRKLGLSMVSPWKFQVFGRNYISGDAVQLSPVGFDAGSYSCGDGINCRQAGVAPSMSFDVDLMLAACHPAPEWFILALGGVLSYTEAHDGTCAGFGVCGPTLPRNWALTPSVGSIAGFDGTPISGVDNSGTTTPAIGGIIAPPVAHYTADPRIPAGTYTYGIGDTAYVPAYDPSVIWRGDQWPGGVLTVSLDGNYSIITTDLIPNLQIFPLWEFDSDRALLTGDTVVLDGSGWEGIPGTAPPPILMSTIAAGPFTTGILRR